VSFCFIFNFLYNLISLHSSSFGRWCLKFEMLICLNFILNG
jgi:hypothetical protein